MADTTVQTPAETEEQAETETKTNFVQRFTNSHPRAAKVTAITGAVISAAGAATLVRTLRANRDRLADAGSEATQAVSDLSASTSPTDVES